MKLYAHKYYIYINRYTASNKRASILAIHGILSDSRIFANLSRLADEGFDIYAIDLPGYGNSEGDRGSVYFDDIIATIHDVKSMIDGQVFLLGFSLGTIYVAHYASMYKDIAGLILASPLLHPIDIIPEYATRLFDLYKKDPKGRINIMEYIQLDDDKREYYLNDDLCNKEYSLSYIAELFLKAIDRSIYTKIDLPVLIIHGKYDTFTDPKQSEEVIRLLNCNKTLKILDTDHWLYDTFFYAPLKNSLVIDMIKGWLDERVS